VRPCSVNGVCTDTQGNFTCTCSPGFSGDGFTCNDINECAANTGRGDCGANAACTNTPGGRTCACDAGYSGDGFTCKDTTPPVLVLPPNQPRVLTATAATGASAAAVGFPSMSATDNLGPASVVCQVPLGAGGAGGAWVDVGTAGASFPVGTTPLACFARDGALPPNESPQASFAVVVSCATGFSFVAGRGCVGEPLRPVTWVGGRSCSSTQRASRPCGTHH
jgi:hypothetical protein